MLETLGPLLVVAVPLGLALRGVGTVVHTGVRNLRQRMATAALDARMAAAPLTPLGKVRPDTDVRALAHAHADTDSPSLTAPMSGRACIAWQITLERGTLHQRQDYAPTLELWVVERVEESGNVLELLDEGVRVCVFGQARLEGEASGSVADGAAAATASATAAGGGARP